MSAALSKVTAEGQVTIPAETLRRMAVAPGDLVRFVERDGGTVIEKATHDPDEFERWLRSVAGTVDLGGVTPDEWLDDIRPQRLDPI
jgi:bifunctional DNA-binding transcriptional regulator/antitoxin component of YhaV-PrlF toxin-antitoxin module